MCSRQLEKRDSSASFLRGVGPMPGKLLLQFYVTLALPHSYCVVRVPPSVNAVAQSNLPLALVPWRGFACCLPCGLLQFCTKMTGCQRTRRAMWEVWNGDILWQCWCKPMRKIILGCLFMWYVPCSARLSADDWMIAHWWWHALLKTVSFNVAIAEYSCFFLYVCKTVCFFSVQHSFVRLFKIWVGIERFLNCGVLEIIW